MFTWLADHGAIQIERKDDILIQLDEYKLKGDDPWADLSAAHEQLSIEFVQTYLERADAEKFIDKRNDGKQAFVSRL